MKTNARHKAIQLRKKGYSYGEILGALSYSVSKSTVSLWCRPIILNKRQKKAIKDKIESNIAKARILALQANQKKRKEYLKSVEARVKNLKNLIGNKKIAKIALGMIYLGEGTKNSKRGFLTFANSDPFIVSLFLNLLRKCYIIDEGKFRCTIQCRADQDIKCLENFWTHLTMIPKPQFYRTRIDKRTVGKISKNLNYKGVCRIDYFSADIFLELLQIPKTIYKNGLVA